VGGIHLAGVAARSGLLMAACLAAGARPAAAQAQPAPSAPQVERDTRAASPDAAPTYSYDPAGRRDPFVSLLARPADLRTSGTRPQGRSGLLVDDLRIRGIVQNQGVYVAMVQAPDGKTYLLRSGDRIFDAAVTRIVANAVVFAQDVTDPLSLVKAREVRKPLRSKEDSK
jgi:type IV pilus assembly protein PilP